MWGGGVGGGGKTLSKLLADIYLACISQVIIV